MLSDIKYSNILNIFEFPAASCFEKDFQLYLKENFFRTAIIDNISNLIYHHTVDSPKLKIGIFTHADEISSYVKGFTETGIIIKLLTADLYAHIGSKLYVKDLNGNTNIFVPIFSQNFQQSNSELEEFEAIPFDEASLNNIEHIVVGMPVTIKKGLEIINDTYIQSKSLDNRLNIYIVYKLLTLIKDQNLPIDILYINTAREEIGHQGINFYLKNNKLETDINIVLDVTNAFNFHNASHHNAEQNNNIDLYGGPVLTNSYYFINQEQYFELLELSEERNFQTRFIENKRITDSNAIFEHTGNCLLVQIPIFSMHSGFEITPLENITDTIKLLFAYLINKIS